MKTTVTIEDDVSAQLARAAQAAGVDVNKLVNDLVRQAIRERPPTGKVAPQPFRQITHKLGWYPGMTWEKIQEMLLEDEAAQYRQAQRGR